MSAEPEWGTAPLFDEPPRIVKQKPATAPRSIAWGNCPCCAHQRVGLIRVGPHLTWRQHDVTTWGGVRVPCRASGVAVCNAAEQQPYVQGSQAAACPHELAERVSSR